MRIIGLSISLLLLSTAAPAQDATQLLKKVAATYESLKNTSYEFEAVEVRETSGNFQLRAEDHMRFVGSGGRYRQEGHGLLYVFDGQFLWTLNPTRGEYLKANAGAPAMPAPALTGYSPRVSQMKNARVLGQETLNFDGTPLVCQVVEAEYQQSADAIEYSPTTYWIDATRNLIRKTTSRYAMRSLDRPPSETLTTVTFSKATVGQYVDEQLLRFTPPPNAVAVDRMVFAGKSSLIGSDSPNFTVQSRDGQRISAEGLRGKMVLLQFSPYPEDDALPFLEMAYRSLRGRGLVAIQVLSSAKSANQAQAGFEVPVAADPGGSVAKQFGISYGGTVLIDRNGKIIYIDTSSRNSMELVRALQKSGVW